jgi:hypothetical protein
MKEKNMMRKGKKVKKYIIKLPDSLATFGDFKSISRSSPILIFPTMCNPIRRTSFVPRDHPFPSSHVLLS